MSKADRWFAYGIIAIALFATLLNILNASRQRRESELRDELFTIRSVIDQYTLDKQKAPRSLDDLVSAGYLKALPRDPITKNRWQVVLEDSLMAVDQQEPGIVDVHSTSNSTSSEGTPYSSW
jgi:general secretion pathway protein G